MAKTKFLLLFIVMFLFTLIAVPVAKSYSAINVEISNNLSIPVEKVDEFSVELPGFNASDNISILDGESIIPTQIIKIDNNKVTLKAMLDFKASEKKELSVIYGSDVSRNYENIFKPNFIGNFFVGFGSGHLYIVSMAGENLVKVYDSKGSLLYDKSLGFNDSADVTLGDNSVFTIRSEKPVFAEVSSLKSDYISNSSDDISSVYGSYFTIYIPKEIFVSSYESTHLKIQNNSGGVVFDGILPERGTYKNLSLKSGFYTIQADSPVSIQFGYSDDNIYTICYGNNMSFKGVSFGDIVYSSIYPNTTVTLKTENKVYNPEELKSPGDYSVNEIINKFKNSETESAPVYLQFSEPIFIYSDSSSGNVGGEQIPSIDGSGEKFIFRTGKIYNFNQIDHQRKVVVIATEDGTSVKINGKSISLNSLQDHQESFSKSFSLVNIESNKPISVFETGVESSIEFLSVLLPVKDNLSISPVEVLKSAGSGMAQSQLSSLLNNVKGPFEAMWQYLISLKFYDGLKNFWHEIMNLLMPISQQIQTYLSQYLPSLTVETISIILFCIILFFIILLLVLIFGPKRRKRVVPKINIEEIKERPVSFNIETIEEKEMIFSEDAGPKVIKLAETDKGPSVKPGRELINIEERELEKPKEGIVEGQYGRKLTKFKTKGEKIEVEKTEEIAKDLLLSEQPLKPVSDEDLSAKVEVREAEGPPSLAEEQPLADKGKELISEKDILEQEQPPIKEEVKEAEIQKPEEVLEEASSIEILLGKLKKEEEPVEEKIPEVSASLKPKIEFKPLLKKVFEHSFVIDAESLNKIFEVLGNDEESKKIIASKVFISATGREKVDSAINDKYRLGVIALTPIELRIAEDISRRINARTGTGEAILIARKIRANEIVVSDEPMIKNYQGILINKTEDIIS
jgi:hypothetical protein